MRNRLAINTTTNNKTAKPINPGIPTSSAKPVDGKPVAVGDGAVSCWRAAACVRSAATVAVLISSVGACVLAGSTTTGVLVGVEVARGCVAVTVGVFVYISAIEV